MALLQTRKAPHQNLAVSAATSTDAMLTLRCRF